MGMADYTLTSFSPHCEWLNNTLIMKPIYIAFGCERAHGNRLQVIGTKTCFADVFVSLVSAFLSIAPIVVLHCTHLMVAGPDKRNVR